MPRELNIEKLERKFTTLTKSRESIQAVSSWIMHHHEFCEEIVEQWYIALTKDQNALVMFYVANEVIQNCGKKRCPQYREAFSKVLEKAVCLEKVKEIKSDLHRILALWKERSIFDDEFFPRLETRLNSSEIVSSPAVEEDEDSELEIISKYKSGNLFDSLKRLKTVELEAKEKNDLLNYADEPQLPDLSNLTVRDECLEMLKKIDSFFSVVKNCLKATNNEIKARENVVKELKYSCIFYTAQHGDVKKVANAYMTYGKRLKIMEKKVSEKMLVLPSPVENDSPCFSESNTRGSPIGAFPFDFDTSSVSRTSSKVSPSSGNEKSHDAIFSSENLKNNTSFWNKISKKASSDFPKSLEKVLEETIQKTPEPSPKQKFSKLAELFAENKLDTERQNRLESDTLDSFSELSNPKSLSSPNQLNENTSDFQTAADQLIDEPKSGENSTELSTDQESKDILDPLTKEVLNEKENTSTVEESNEIDLLLEESYDTKKSKSKVSVKRKIELLLKSSGKKICTEASKEKKSDSVLESKTSVKDSVLEGGKSSEDTINEEIISINNLCNTGISEKNITCTDSKVTLPIVSSASKKVEKTPPDDISAIENMSSDIKKNLSLEEKIQNVSNIFVPSANAIEQCKDIDFFSEQSDIQDSLTNNHELSGEDNRKDSSIVISESNIDSGSSKVPENDNFSIQTPSTFFDSSLFSSISSISTEFLKNILGKNKSSPSENVEDSHVTDTSTVKDCTETEKLVESKDSENIIKSPVFDSPENGPLTEETLVSSNIVTKPLSPNESAENCITHEIKIQEDTNIQSTTSLDSTSIKSNESELPTTDELEIPKCTVTDKQGIPECTVTDKQGISECTVTDKQGIPECTVTDKQGIPECTLTDKQGIPECTVTDKQGIPECTVIKPEETVLGSNDKKIYVPDSDVQLKPNDQLETEKTIDKPNLLLTLQNILECISNKNISICDSKNVWEAPPMSFDNCLSMYHTLKSADTKFANVSNSCIAQNATPLKTTTESSIISEVYNQDNLEVMDMECDSE